ncbi:hypothetical protein ABVF54_11780 [Enterococcus mundtii]|uniref:Peptidylarginine deiminase and related enzymes n=1 Tax=Enterococcus mundtii TaxID=53346 RepID=A0AAI8RBB2_ENTMU|nr:hypothetical protein [Enterococcus mundtii]BBM16335.1 peptidylarginine deiminase and related enzymes [Enterococcus mundtii]
MNPSLTKDEYMRQFQENTPQDKRKSEELNVYLAQQFEQLDQLTSTISPENFWENLPIVLGIDAKLSLITELIHYDYNKLPINEILRIVEKDYRTYFKELCGNNLSTNNYYSMVYNLK